MNPELQKQLADMLAKLTDATTGAVTWASAQIPPLVTEKIALGRAEESLWMAFSIALFIGAAICSVMLWRSALSGEGMDEDTCAAICFGQLVLFALGLLPVYWNLHSFLLVWFAPRLYIVEWLKTMVTK